MRKGLSRSSKLSSKKIVRKPIKKTVKPLAKFAKKPAKKRMIKSVAKLVKKSVVKPIKKPVAKKKVVKPAVKLIRKPVAKKKVVKPAVRLIKKPAAKKKVVKPAAKFIKKPVAKKKIVKPAAKAAPKQNVLSFAKGKRLNSSGLLTEIPVYQPKLKESYMNARMQEHFRKLLQTIKEDLLSRIGETLKNIEERPLGCSDANDRATEEEELSLMLHARDRESKLVKKIDEAIQALDQGEYGYCENCAGPIGLARLELRPTATLCVDCKEWDEMREKKEKGE